MDYDWKALLAADEVTKLKYFILELVNNNTYQDSVEEQTDRSPRSLNDDLSFFSKSVLGEIRPPFGSYQGHRSPAFVSQILPQGPSELEFRNEQTWLKTIYANSSFSNWWLRVSDSIYTSVGRVVFKILLFTNWKHLTKEQSIC